MDNSLRYAQELDKQDPLNTYRDKFHFPQFQGKNCIYFCGNSLGLQPKSVEGYIQQELEDWKKLGVEGHFDGKTSGKTCGCISRGSRRYEYIIRKPQLVNGFFLSAYRPTI